MISADAPRRISEIRDDVAPDLEATILRCLDKDRDARFASVAELVLALKPFAPGDCLPSVERISKTLGTRVTRPPPLPSPRAKAIVHVASPPASRAPMAPVAAPLQPAGWLMLVAFVGMAAGALGASVALLSTRPAPEPVVRAVPPTPVAASPAQPASLAISTAVSEAPPAPALAPAPRQPAAVAVAAAPAPAKAAPIAQAPAQATSPLRAPSQGATTGVHPSAEARATPPSREPLKDLFDDTR